MDYTILLNPGHGKDTPGKCSPPFNGERLYEWQFSRDLAAKIAELSPINVVNIVPEEEDILLTERANRVNKYIKDHKDEQCILFDLHGNAAGSGNWMSAHGWEAWTTVGKTKSDDLAEILCNIIKEQFTDIRLRKDTIDGDLDKEKNWTVILKAKCPAVLTENLFYDNKEDLALMMDEGVRYAFAQAHVDAALKYFNINV